MAAAKYYVRLSQQSEVSTVIILGVYDSPQETHLTNLDNLARGDEIYFAKDFVGSPSNFTVSSVNNLFEGNPFPLTVSTSNYDATVTVAYTATYPSSNTLTFSYTGKTDTTLAYSIIQPDATPNQFTFVDQIDLDPNSTFITRVQVNGFTGTLDVSFGDFVGTSVDIKIYRERGTQIKDTLLGFEAGDYIRITGKAQSAYNVDYVVRVFLGGTVNDYLAIRTKDEPLLDELIQLSVVAPAPIRLKRDVFAFFGGRITGSPLLADYVRGGLYVPDISQNASAIPTTEPIHLHDLYEAYTAYYFTVPPVSKEVSANTTGTGTHSLSVGWDKRQADKNLHDWRVGYGDNLELNAKYMYEVIHLHEHPTNDITINSNNAMDHTIYDTANTYINLSATVNQNEEKIYWGKLRINARNTHDLTEYTITREVDWALIFYGP